MFTRWNSRLRKSPRRALPGRRSRRLGIERVEYRCLLSAVAFQTGMEVQFDANEGSANGFVVPLYSTAETFSSNGTIGRSLTQLTIGPGTFTFPQGVANFAFGVMPDIVQSGGGSVVFQPIHLVDLPPAPAPPAPAPIDIGQVPPRVIQGNIAPPESTPAPVFAGSVPPAAIAPTGVAAKPDVEGNRGKSQVMDVASSQGPQSDAGETSSPIQSPSAVAAVSFTNGDYHAMPTASGVDGLMRETAAEDGKTLAMAVASDSLAVRSESARGTSNAPSSDQPVAVAAVVPDSVSAPLAPASDLAAAGSSAAANLRSEENAGKLLAAGKYWRADIVGLAVLAFAGQHLVERWRYPAPDQPRPIAIRGKEPCQSKGNRR